ncbi:MAG: DNA-3-methyladenine glycosylase 2 family protein [Ferruginibacter sp.]
MIKKERLSHQTFNKKNFKQICDQLAAVDGDLQIILDSYGYPPLWKRTPGFETLVQIILEQQVSLASAKAAYMKLRERLTNITPEAILLLTDEELRACYFSRQKIIYTRHLAAVISSGQLDLKQFKKFNNDQVRSALIQIKGIGNWTVDVYLMMAMQRTDLFPLGDIALINSIKAIKKLEPAITKLDIAQLAESWKPYQTVAAYMLWHAYLSKKKR